MNKKHWEIIKKCASMENVGEIPVALIVDSPWMPGYTGMSTIDFLTIPDKWFEAYLKIKEDFPDLIFLPDFWVEYGMATEPSGFGCKVSFYEKSTPTISHIISSVDEYEELNEIQLPNPRTDGLMPFVLNIYNKMEHRVKEIGESIKIVAARGPLTTAAHLIGMTEFLMGMKLYPEVTHKLLRTTSTLTKNWLEAQADVLSEVEGVMVLDDVVGFLSESDFKEFAYPYFKDIFDSVKGYVKIYHNDMDNTICYKYLEDMGVNIFNFTHLQSMSKVRQIVGNKVCLMGNIPPLDVLTYGTPEQVSEKTYECLKDYGSSNGIIISAGGGTSPGTPKENIKAMIDAVKSFKI